MGDDLTTVLLGLVRELVGVDECWYDHHGYCQAHGLQDAPCPHERARALLAELDIEEPSP